MTPVVIRKNSRGHRLKAVLVVETTQNVFAVRPNGRQLPDGYHRCGETHGRAALAPVLTVPDQKNNEIKRTIGTRSDTPFTSCIVLIPTATHAATRADGQSEEPDDLRVGQRRRRR